MQEAGLHIVYTQGFKIAMRGLNGGRISIGKPVPTCSHIALSSQLPVV